MLRVCPGSFKGSKKVQNQAIQIRSSDVTFPVIPV
jgi:hypothetical protein